MVKLATNFRNFFIVIMITMLAITTGCGGDDSNGLISDAVLDTGTIMSGADGTDEITFSMNNNSGGTGEIAFSTNDTFGVFEGVADNATLNAPDPNYTKPVQYFESFGGIFLSIQTPSNTVSIKDTQLFKAFIQSGKGTVFVPENCAFYSSNPKVGLIDSNGRFTAISAGTTYITVTYTYRFDGRWIGLGSYRRITVIERTSDYRNNFSIILDKNIHENHWIKPAGIYSLEADTSWYFRDSVFSNWKWYSSNPDVVKVSQISGKKCQIQALVPGSAKIVCEVLLTIGQYKSKYLLPVDLFVIPSFPKAIKIVPFGLNDNKLIYGIPPVKYGFNVEFYDQYNKIMPSPPYENNGVKWSVYPLEAIVGNGPQSNAGTFSPIPSRTGNYVVNFQTVSSNQSFNFECIKSKTVLVDATTNKKLNYDETINIEPNSRGLELKAYILGMDNELITPLSWFNLKCNWDYLPSQNINIFHPTGSKSSALFNAISDGTTEVFVRFGEHLPAKVTLVSRGLYSLRLNAPPDGFIATVNSTFQNRYEVLHYNGSVISDARARVDRWNSSDNSIATVDGNGLVKFLKPGFVVISAHCYAYNARSSLNFTVLDGPVPSKIVLKCPAVIGVGKGEALSVEVMDQYLRPMNAANMNVSFTTSDTRIAWVEQPSTLVGVGEGKVSITAVLNKLKATASTLVSKQSVPGRIEIYGARIMPVLGTVKLSANVYDQFGDLYTKAPVLWSSSNLNMATVDRNGIVKSKRKGTIYITASVDKLKSDFVINCHDIPTLSSLELSGPDTIGLYQSITVNCKRYDQFGNPIGDKSALTWKQSNSIIRLNVQGSGDDATLIAYSPGECEITVTAANAYGIAIEAKKKFRVPVLKSLALEGPSTIYSGQQVRMKVIARDQFENDYKYSTVTWKSSNSGIATVAPDGTVTGLKYGWVRIIAVVNTGSPAGREETAYFDMMVKEIPVPARLVIIDKNSAKLMVNSKYQFQATLYDQLGGIMQMSQPVKWWVVHNSGLKAGDITSTGLLTTSIDFGKITIYASYGNIIGSISKEIIKPASIKIDGPQTCVVFNDITFNSTIFDYSSNPLTGLTVKWSSSDPTIAKISDTGKLSGLKTGEVTITAEFGTIFSTIKVAVVPSDDQVLISGPADGKVELGGSVKLTATVRNKNGILSVQPVITWNSSDTRIATVDGTGNVKGITPGTVDITATLPDKVSSSFKIIVFTLGSISVNGAPTMRTGESGEYKIVARDNSGAEMPLASSKVVWSSSDVSVAVVDSNGKVTCKKPGTAKIIATSATITGSLNLTVSDLSIPGGGSFTDADLNAKKISGNISWTAASPATAITGYKIYWGQNATTKLTGNETAVYTVADPAATAKDVAAGTTLPGGATHFLIYSYNAGGESAVCLAIAITDRAIPTVLPSSGRFNDNDIYSNYISGNITWTAAAPVTGINGYKIYWGENATTKLTGNTAEVFTIPDPTATMQAVAPKTVLPAGANCFLIYSYNSDGESASCLAVPISNIIIVPLAAPNVLPTAGSFTDTDNNSNKISGNITWTAANPTTGISGYRIYWGENATTKLTGNAAVVYTVAGAATATQAVAADTSLPVGATHFLVYSYNDAGNSSACLAVAITDTAIPSVLPTAGGFTDADLAVNKISGNITWTAASPATGITGYKIYWGENATTKLTGSAAVVYTVAGAATAIQAVAADTSLPAGATHFLIYSYNAVGDSASCLAVPITDKFIPTVLPTAGSFTDTDNTANKISGNITWTAASPTTGITGYKIYWGENATTKLTGSTAVVYTVAGAATATQAVAADTSLPAGATHFLIYSYSADGDSAACLAVALNDLSFVPLPAGTYTKVTDNTSPTASLNISLNGANLKVGNGSTTDTYSLTGYPTLQSVMTNVSANNKFTLDADGKVSAIELFSGAPTIAITSTDSASNINVKTFNTISKLTLTGSAAGQATGITVQSGWVDISDANLSGGTYNLTATAAAKVTATGKNLAAVSGAFTLEINGASNAVVSGDVTTLTVSAGITNKLDINAGVGTLNVSDGVTIAAMDLAAVTANAMTIAITNAGVINALTVDAELGTAQVNMTINDTAAGTPAVNTLTFSAAQTQIINKKGTGIVNTINANANITEFRVEAGAVNTLNIADGITVAKTNIYAAGAAMTIAVAGTGKTTVLELRHTMVHTLTLNDTDPATPAIDTISNFVNTPNALTLLGTGKVDTFTNTTNSRSNVTLGNAGVNIFNTASMTKLDINSPAYVSTLNIDDSKTVATLELSSLNSGAMTLTAGTTGTGVITTLKIDGDLGNGTLTLNDAAPAGAFITTLDVTAAQATGLTTAGTATIGTMNLNAAISATTIGNASGGAHNAVTTLSVNVNQTGKIDFNRWFGTMAVNDGVTVNTVEMTDSKTGGGGTSTITAYNNAKINNFTIDGNLPAINLVINDTVPGSATIDTFSNTTAITTASLINVYGTGSITTVNQNYAIPNFAMRMVGGITNFNSNAAISTTLQIGHQTSGGGVANLNIADGVEINELRIDSVVSNALNINCNATGRVGATGMITTWAIGGAGGCVFTINDTNPGSVPAAMPLIEINNFGATPFGDLAFNGTATIGTIKNLKSIPTMTIGTTVTYLSNYNPATLSGSIMTLNNNGTISSLQIKNNPITMINNGVTENAVITEMAIENGLTINTVNNGSGSFSGTIGKIETAGSSTINTLNMTGNSDSSILMPSDVSGTRLTINNLNINNAAGSAMTLANTTVPKLKIGNISLGTATGGKLLGSGTAAFTLAGNINVGGAGTLGTPGNDALLTIYKPAADNERTIDFTLGAKVGATLSGDTLINGLNAGLEVNGITVASASGNAAAIDGTSSGTGSTVSMVQTSGAVNHKNIPKVIPTAGSFTDTDGDGDQIGGNITWTAANPTTGITGYHIYWGESATKKLTADPAVKYTVANPDTALQAVAADTALPAGATHFLVYSYNANGDSGTCLAITITDVMPTTLPAGTYVKVAANTAPATNWEVSLNGTALKVGNGSSSVKYDMAGNPTIQSVAANLADSNKFTIDGSGKLSAIDHTIATGTPTIALTTANCAANINVKAFDASTKLTLTGSAAGQTTGITVQSGYIDIANGNLSGGTYGVNASASVKINAGSKTLASITGAFAITLESVDTATISGVVTQLDVIGTVTTKLVVNASGSVDTLNIADSITLPLLELYHVNLNVMTISATESGKIDTLVIKQDVGGGNTTITINDTNPATSTIDNFNTGANLGNTLKTAGSGYIGTFTTGGTMSDLYLQHTGNGGFGTDQLNIGHSVSNIYINNAMVNLYSQTAGTVGVITGTSGINIFVIKGGTLNGYTATTLITETYLNGGNLTAPKNKLGAVSVYEEESTNALNATITGGAASTWDIYVYRSDTATPSGSNVTVSGTAPNWTINRAGTGADTVTVTCPGYNNVSIATTTDATNVTQLVLTTAN